MASFMADLASIGAFGSSGGGSMPATCAKAARRVDRAAAPDVAEPLYEGFCAALRDEGLPVDTGRFGASMAVELVNDGPVTFLLEVMKQDR